MRHGFESQWEQQGEFYTFTRRPIHPFSIAISRQATSFWTSDSTRKWPTLVSPSWPRPQIWVEGLLMASPPMSGELQWVLFFSLLANIVVDKLHTLFETRILEICHENTVDIFQEYSSNIQNIPWICTLLVMNSPPWKKILLLHVGHIPTKELPHREFYLNGWWVSCWFRRLSHQWSTSLLPTSCVRW